MKQTTVLFVLKKLIAKYRCPCKAATFRYWVNQGSYLLTEALKMDIYDTTGVEGQEGEVTCKVCLAKFELYVDWSNRAEPVFVQNINGFETEGLFPEDTKAKALHGYWEDDIQESWVNFMLSEKHTYT